ncbi:MAG: RDD family protein [Filimonas sp.]|nr:RDD family protein [Filimonas sp.]
MEKINVRTSFNIELEFEAADFLKRFLAWLIDLAIIIAYLIIVNKILKSVAGTKDTPSDNFLENISALGMIASIPALMYHLIFEIILNGQTIGKKLMNIRVINETGGRPGLHQYLLRWLLRFVDFTLTLGTGALLTALLSKKHQRIGDFAAGTIVIRATQESRLDETVFYEINSNYQPLYTNVMLLSDRDMNIIKGVFDAAMKAGNPRMADHIAYKLRSILKIEQEQDNLVFLERILMDYNYYANQS